jgi:hypothetical protein
MLHACVQRFDLTENLKILAKFLASKRCLDRHEHDLHTNCASNSSSSSSNALVTACRPMFKPAGNGPCHPATAGASPSTLKTVSHCVQLPVSAYARAFDFISGCPRWCHIRTYNTRSISPGRAALARRSRSIELSGRRHVVFSVFRPGSSRASCHAPAAAKLRRSASGLLTGHAAVALI